MNYSMKQIRLSLPAEKKRADGIWTVYILRPLSIPVTWIALRLGLSANAVSYISAFFSIGGGLLFGINGFWISLLGVILLNFFSILDCVDGNIARVTKTASPWGGWADAVMGNVAYTAVFLSTGVYVYLRSGWWPVLLVTALTSSANLLTRAAYQMYKNIEPDNAHGSISFERMLAENVGITGLLMPALVVCHFTGGMIWIVW
ncbi:MAG: CDP-alcohol phosphatidyltransferase family protein, partial [Spirochaetales bacterium]|nr:CDP-alcohol phosphatidyltransferase family protein [Spirochaetales bacterium]